MVSLNRIQNIVLNYYNLPEHDLSEKTRRQPYIECKQVYHYIAREVSRKSLKKIGETTNNDYSTVINSCLRVEDRISVYPNLKKAVEEMIESCLKYKKVKGKNLKFKELKTKILKSLEETQSKKCFKKQMILELMEL